MSVEAKGEFHDWEILPDSSESDSVISTHSLRDLEGFGGESQGMIQVDYFSLDNSNYFKLSPSNHESIESDNPSQVNPELDGPVIGKEPVEVLPDSSVDRTDDLKFGDFEENKEMSSIGNGKSLVGFEGIGEIDSPKNELGSVGNGKTLAGFREIAEIGSEGEFSLTKNESSDVVENRENLAVFKGIEPQSLEFSEIGLDSDMGRGIYVNSDVGEEISVGENDVLSGEQINPPMEVTKAAGEGEKKSVVWWKVPFKLLRFCAFRVSPMWTFSMAAAVMGVVMLTRRLYMMKKKSRALQLKVSMNDKKVSQFMSQADRLNKALSAVKWVPVIRPALLTSDGIIQWPVMNLR